MKKTPRRAIVLHCRECIENGRPKDCKIDTCPSWPMRGGHRVVDAEGKGMSPLKTIRRHCLDCCLGNPNEVKACIDTKCQLWEYRSGHRPKNEDP